MRLDAYTIVFLRRPTDAPHFTEEQLDELQRGHLAFNARMKEEGHALITGPFLDQPDVAWRGIGVFRTSVEETRKLLAGDPAQISPETIYVSLYVQGRGSLRAELTKHLRTQRTFRRAKNEIRRQGPKMLPDPILISQRPAEANDRAVPGHWEGDLLFGTPTTAVGTLVERSTRYLMLFILARGPRAQAVREGIAASIVKLPLSLRRSLAWDQGAEMSQHQRFTVETGLAVYFCDPGSPWQRGSNENTNGLLRQYFPKNRSLAHVTQAELDRVADQFNGRPRETLGWRTPAEALADLLKQSA